MRPTRKEILLAEIASKQETQILLRRQINERLQWIADGLAEADRILYSCAEDLAKIVKLLTPPAVPATIVFRPPLSQESP